MQLFPYDGCRYCEAHKGTVSEAFEADKRTGYGARDKLGTVSSAICEIGDHRLTVVNAYTQFQWKGRGRKADYEAIRQAFAAIRAGWSGQRIGYPMIGAGLAGGDWTIIAAITDEELAGEDHTLIEFDGSR